MVFNRRKFALSFFDDSILLEIKFLLLLLLLLIILHNIASYDYYLTYNKILKFK